MKKANEVQLEKETQVRLPQPRHGLSSDEWKHKRPSGSFVGETRTLRSDKSKSWVGEPGCTRQRYT